MGAVCHGRRCGDCCRSHCRCCYQAGRLACGAAAARECVVAGHEAAQRKADRVGRHVVPLIDEARPAADGMARREEQLVRLHRREHALTRHSQPLQLQLELLRVV